MFILHDAPHRGFIFTNKRKLNYILLLFPFVYMLVNTDNKQLNDIDKGYTFKNNKLNLINHDIDKRTIRNT